MSFALIMLGGLLLDLLLGWPAALFARIGHPVTWIGRAISGCEASLNCGSHRRRLVTGAITTLLIVLGVGGLACAVQYWLPDGWVGIILGSVLAWPMIAMRSMYDHVAAVARPLGAGQLSRARAEVAMIVGRDTSQLDEAAVARGAIESLAENTSDGIIAPLFWGVLLGLPGLYSYKAINTLDSMIGHRSPQYEAFGKVAARVDDVVNWIPARITGLVFAIVSGRPLRALRVIWQDASKHRSPNAGWPEAAMAAGLGVRLSGPRAYEDRIAEEPFVNDGAADPSAQDLSRALSLFRYAMTFAGVALGVLALF